MDVCRSPPQQAPEATSFAANKLSVQSYRRSCDRCHVQKLKCSRNTRSPTQCQRCERAGHKCVYSQRNPRQSTRVKGNASSAARGGAGQSHQLPIQAGGDDASSDKLSPEWPGTLDGDTVDLLQEWTWQDFTGGPLGEYHDLLGQTLYSPQTTSTPLSAKEGTNTATASEQQDVFERLSSISKTLEDYVHFLANQWDRKEIQNYPIGEVFGTFQAFLTTLQVQRPIEKPGVLEGCQHTRTVLLASHCYTVCVKIMEALAETLCQDMSTQASQNALRQPPGDVISASGSEVDFLVGESFSHLHPLASSLVSACTTLHTGVSILCKVEVELGVPWGNSIMAREALPAEGDGDALFPSQRSKGSAGFTQAARFLGVMREGAGSDFGYISNLQNFHRHHAEILRLTRQHTVCFLSKILSPQTTRT
ncbi:Transcription fator mokH [Colletotrichum tabaci]|uniref:Transcription fator mokH n=1 Tax=Colletotrichum tabaci TaxID=1209068 RepID=A0AAV9TR95_9PEZI